jgi:hypothetical protein
MGDHLARDTWLAHLRIHRALASLGPILTRAEVPWLVVKGAALAHLMYEDLAERPLADLDLRIRPEDYARAERALRGGGIRIVERAPVYRNLVAEVGGQAVDIEGFVVPPFTARLSTADLLRRARSLDLADAFAPEPLAPLRVLVPEVHDHALLLVANLVKDKLHRAATWAARDARDIVSMPDFDPSTFAARAHEAGMVTCVKVAATHFLDDPLPFKSRPIWQGLADALGGAAPQRRAYRALYTHLAATRPSALVTRVTARLIADRPLDRIRALGTALRWEFETGRKRTERNL